MSFRWGCLKSNNCKFVIPTAKGIPSEESGNLFFLIFLHRGCPLSRVWHAVFTICVTSVIKVNSRVNNQNSLKRCYQTYSMQGANLSQRWITIIESVVRNVYAKTRIKSGNTWSCSYFKLRTFFIIVTKS